jgi:hypothetical protein
MLDAECIEFVLDQALGPVLFKAQLRLAVYRAAQFNDALNGWCRRFFDHFPGSAAAVRGFPASESSGVMIGADAALAALINRAASTYLTSAPTYITFHESTHIEGANKSEDINRAVSVRVADDYAVMQDLPNGSTRLGPAFPVIPFFDPFSTFRFGYFANLKKIDITFDPGRPFQLQLPAPEPGIDVLVPYFSEFAPRYAPDSTDDALHLLIEPTPRTGNDTFYPSEVTEDPATHLPSHITLQDNGTDMTIGLDYSMVDGYWVVTRGTWSATQHVALIGAFKVNAVTTFSDFTFPTTAPDPRLAGTPTPSPSASPSPGGTP